MKKRYVQNMMAIAAVTLSVLLSAINVWAAIPEKEQTVYVNADENGNTQKVIVSNWLKNPKKKEQLTDKTDLTNIQNVKGEESFTQKNDGKIIWNADGNDIYYQGETKEELPISVKMTYFLNGKEIRPSELAGKSGKVKIHIDYENKTAEGKEVCTPFLMVTGMILPTEKFTNVEVENGRVISDGQNNIVVGMGFPGLADSLKLSDVEGLENKEIPDYVEIMADVQNFSLALTATVATTGTLNELGLSDIDSFDDLQESLDTLSESSEALVKGSKALQEGIKQLNSSADTFVDGLNSADGGAGKLKTGIDTMNDKKGELVEGATALAAGVKELDAGAKSLQSGINAYTGKVSELSAGLRLVYGSLDNYEGMFKSMSEKLSGLMSGINGAKDYIDMAINALDSVPKIDTSALSQEATRQAQEAAAVKLQEANAQQAESIKKALAVEDLTEEQKLAIQNCFGDISSNTGDISVTITDHMTENTDKINQQLTTARSGLNQVSQGLSGAVMDEKSVENIKNSFATLKDGLGKLTAGSTELCKNNDTLTDGAKELVKGTESAKKGTEALAVGANTLSGGISQLADGANELKDGTASLAAGGKKLKDGTTELKDGSGNLADGMKKFDEEGIQKLVSVMENGIQDVLERLKDIADADKEYGAFDGWDKDMDGSVKFIIETAGIEE